MPESIPSTRVVVVDDHPLILDGIRAQLDAQPHIDVVGVTARGEDAIGLAAERRADIVLMDIALQGINGIEATRLMMRQGSPTAVIMLTMHDEAEYVIQAVHAGARGYVLKSDPPGALVAAIEAVRRGDTAFSPAVADALDRDQQAGAATKAPLAPRERQVLALIASGRLNKEIARELTLSVRTVETYRERLMRKLEIHSVAELTRYAVAEGIVALD